MSHHAITEVLKTVVVFYMTEQAPVTTRTSVAQILKVLYAKLLTYFEWFVFQDELLGRAAETTKQ